MTLELGLLLGFIFHFVGDYIFQNNWMAVNKVSDSIVALCYSILFLCIVGFSFWWILILGTHFLIDRYRLAVYWIKLVNNSWGEVNNGYGDGMPKWMSVWLMIIIDNTFHVVINSVCIGLSMYY